MDQNKEIYIKIAEIAKDIKFIREQLSEGKETFKEHAERIRQIEQNQQLLTGKVAIMIMVFGAGILFIMNLIARLWK